MGKGTDKNTGKPKQLTLFQRQESANLCRHVIETVGLYLADGIEMSIREAGISNEDFWEELFRSTGEKTILENRKPTLRTSVPGNPFWMLDYQACAKYLAFGHQRERDDSVYFCRRFNVGLFGARVEGNDEFAGFRGAARRCTWIRNDYMHIARQSLTENITPQKVWGDIEKLKRLTDPMRRAQQKEGFSFSELPELETFWASVWTQCTNLINVEPIPLEVLGQELFLAEKMSEGQREELMRALAYLGISEETGRVYGDEVYKEPSREDLVGKLRYAVDQLRRGDKAEPPEVCEQKWEAEKAEREEERKREYPVPERPVRPVYTSGELAFSRESVSLGTAELNALIDCFNILLDESVFLNSDGRHGVEEALIPGLKRARDQIVKDDSIDRSEREVRVKKISAKMYRSSVSELFRLFRESRPLSAEELEDWGDEAEEEQANRDRVRTACKKGIGETLSALRTENCLTVSPSLVDEESTHENFRRLAEKFPDKLFLVLTCSESLAAELGKVGARNVVAARFVRRINDDFALRIFDATQNNWVEIMGLGSGPSGPNGSSPDNSANAADCEELHKNLMELAGGEVQSPRSASACIAVNGISDLKEDGLEGARLTVAAPDGSVAKITLGSKIGFGGEGAIYAVSGPEGYTDTAVKIYRPGHRTQSRLDKLNYMIANDPKIDILCWPRALVCGDSGAWMGFLMPLAQGEPLAYTVYNLGEDAANIREKLGWDRKALVKAAEKIAEGFARMHRCGILMGDINPRNILAARDCSVRFVDCDSYQVGDFLCPVGMVQYIPPEVLCEQGTDGVNYSYRRSEDHERYSLAVLLFEVLMLGKPPYVSRNNNAKDIKDAVLAGIFPYRFNSGEEYAEFDEEDEAEARRRLERRGLLAPAGMWRTIWSNTTHKVKQAFYDTFKNGKRCSAWDWKQTMRQYVFEIEQGSASPELIPRSFKILKGDEAAEGICADCGEKVRMLKSELEMLKRQGKPVYCHQHREERRLFSQLCEIAQCTKCGRIYSEKVRYLILPDFKPVCGDCGQTEAQCACCGAYFHMESTKKEELEEQGKPIYCGDCLYVEAECADCGGKVQMPRFKYEKLQRENKDLWCDDCRQRRLAR